MSLRYRPDYIIVGEIRGEEAYVLFQAVATGHGGLCTIHADSLDNVVKRLTSPPMNVSNVYIPLMNAAVHIHRVELPKAIRGITFGRRIRTMWEIEDFDVYREVSNWEVQSDTFNTHFEDSYHLRQIAINNSMAFEDVLKELDARESYIREIAESNVRGQRDVAEKILSYYSKRRASTRDESSSPVNPQPSVSS
jgi:flagellar protein FlaI